MTTFDFEVKAPYLVGVLTYEERPSEQERELLQKTLDTMAKALHKYLPELKVGKVPEVILRQELIMYEKGQEASFEEIIAQDPSLLTVCTSALERYLSSEHTTEEKEVVGAFKSELERALHKVN
jgi:hypothetical protein